MKKIYDTYPASDDGLSDQSIAEPTLTRHTPFEKFYPQTLAARNRTKGLAFRLPGGNIYADIRWLSATACKSGGKDLQRQTIESER